MEGRGVVGFRGDLLRLVIAARTPRCNGVLLPGGRDSGCGLARRAGSDYPVTCYNVLCMSGLTQRVLEAFPTPVKEGWRIGEGDYSTRVSE